MHTNKPRNPSHDPNPGKASEPVEPGNTSPVNPDEVEHHPVDTD